MRHRIESILICLVICQSRIPSATVSSFSMHRVEVDAEIPMYRDLSSSFFKHMAGRAIRRPEIEAFAPDPRAVKVA